MRKLIRFFSVVLLLCLMVQGVRAEDTVEYSTVGGTWVQVDDSTWTMDKDNDGTADITLVKNGDTWKYYFVVADDEAEYYGWEEEVPGGYELEGNGTRQNPLIFTKEGTLVNKVSEEAVVPLGGFTLSKEVIGEGIENASFKFDIVLSTEDENLESFLSGTLVLDGVMFQDGVGYTYLGNGDSVTISGLPYGIRYSISEQQASDYEVSWSYTGGAVTGNGVNGEISSEDIIPVICRNTKKASEGGGTEEGGQGIDRPERTSLTVQKEVEGAVTDEGFQFMMAFWGLEPGTAYSTDTGLTFTSDPSGMGDASFVLKGGESICFTGLPVGCQYQVVECESGYIARYDILNAVSAVEAHGENTAEGRQLATSKETADSGELCTVVFTNHKDLAEPPEAVEVKARKVWDDQDDLYGRRPDEVMVYLMQDENIISAAVINEMSGWEVTFQDLEKYREDGITEYAYTVSEEPVPNYETSYGTDGNGYNVITNTLVETGRLSVRKTVAGSTDGKKFNIKVSIRKEGDPLSGVYNMAGGGTIAFDENGESIVSLSDGETIIIDGLPAGTEYAIEEQPYGDYTASYSGKTGMISPGLSEAEVTNTYIDSHDITVSKVITGNMGNRSHVFRFKVHFESGRAEAFPDTFSIERDGAGEGITLDENGDYYFTLGNNEKILFKDIPVGTKYKVEELDGESRGYLVKGKNTYGYVEDVNIDIPFNNIKNVGIPTGILKIPESIACILFGLTGIFLSAIYFKKH